MNGLGVGEPSEMRKDQQAGATGQVSSEEQT